MTLSGLNQKNKVIGKSSPSENENKRVEYSIALRTCPTAAANAQDDLLLKSTLKLV